MKEICDISASDLISAIYDCNQESLVELICCEELNNECTDRAIFIRRKCREE